MKDFIISGEELFVHFREGNIVYPQNRFCFHLVPVTKRLLWLSSTIARKRDVSSSKARKMKWSLQMVIPHWFSSDGSHTFYLAVVPMTSADKNGSCKSLAGEHRMNMYPFPYLSLNQTTCRRDVWYHVRISQATYILPRKKAVLLYSTKFKSWQVSLPAEVGNI